MSPENKIPASLVDSSIDFRGNPEVAALQFTDAKDKARLRGTVNVADMQCYTDITTNESTFTHALNPYRKYGHKKAFLSDKLPNDEFSSLMKKAICGNFIFNQSISTFLSEGPDGANLINLHVPPTYLHGPKQITTSLPDLYRDFFATLIPNQEARNYVLDWIAASFTTKLRVFLTLIGEEGIGKGVLFDILSLLHGSKQSVKMNAKNLKSTFNAQMSCKSIIAFDEITIDKDNEPTIKLLEGRTIQYEKKHFDSKEIEFHSSIVLMSNEYNQGLGEGSRRFAVPELIDTKMVDWDLIKRDYKSLSDYIRALLNHDNIRALFWYLHERIITSNLEIPYKGQKFHDVVDAGLKEWENIARSYAMGHSPCTCEAIIKHLKEKGIKYDISAYKIQHLFKRTLSSSFTVKSRSIGRSQAIITFTEREVSVFEDEDDTVNQPLIREVVSAAGSTIIRRSA